MEYLISGWLKLRNRHLLFLDLFFLSFTPAIALLLRVDTPFIWTHLFYNLFFYTLIAMFLRVLIHTFFGLYGRYWRYASAEDVTQITLAVTVSSMLVIAFFFLTNVLVGGEEAILPRSVPFIDSLLVLIVVGGTRFSVRLANNWWKQARPHSASTRVLVVGAGESGIMIVREMQNHAAIAMEPVGFVDDDPEKRSVRIRGLRVLGKRHDIPELVREYHINQVVIAMPTASGQVIREIKGMCEKMKIKTRIIPGIYELLDGKVSINQIRDVEIEDLLRRDPVQTDLQAVRTLLVGKRVMITGGGGSIGSELCRQVLRCEPAQLIVLGHGENSVFAVQHELLAFVRREKLNTEIESVIADVRFARRINEIMHCFQPEIVFHAAAHKHVPLMELNPGEAITNNVLGTQNILRAALSAGVKRFVMVSTDKAVNPTSIMGASKRAAELLVHQAAAQSRKPYVAVRFGNVLGSRGSVVLTFKQQIAAGGPVTVTDPEMTRFFMTIPEAVQLLLQAAVVGTGGEVFVLDMGQPVKIMDLARDLIELSGLRLGQDIDIAFTGMRPGEKLYEELFVPGENYERTQHQKIFIAANASHFLPHDLDEQIKKLGDAAANDDPLLIKHALRDLIPEYQGIDKLYKKRLQDPAITARPPYPEPRSRIIPTPQT
ncbi:MAG: polysaccharide biosynthesis protein [Chloroflexi bacterium]|nr:polysaccharide biosynthesis protein [Chloroflexota bacterium]MBP8054556.1 polysaccharide biosynthesis protein [Chloroflexota bacterium]